MEVPGGTPQAVASPPHVAVVLPITLGQFLKVAGLATTGGEAKQLVMAGLVKVNGSVDIRRGHHLEVGDVVEVRGLAAMVAIEDVPRLRG